MRRLPDRPLPDDSQRDPRTVTLDERLDTFSHSVPPHPNGRLLGVLSELHGSAELNAKDSTPLLPSSRGTAYTARGIHKLIAQSTETASLSKPVSPHWLRHTHATLAAAGGAPAVVIQASLGHARLETSQRYIHWARGLEEITVDSLPSLS